MNNDVRAMVRDMVLEVLEDQLATVQRGDGVLRSGTKERRQALVFCAEAIASRVAERLDRRDACASENGNAAGRERATVDLEDLDRKARAVTETRSPFELSQWTALQATDRRRWRDEQMAAAGSHIAANSPPVTLALIARIRELEKAYREILDDNFSELDTISERALLDEGVVLT